MYKAEPVYNELKELCATLLPAVGKQVYAVPDGYFDAFPLKMAGKIEKSTLSAPEGYFDGFADTMLKRVHNLESSETPESELRSLSTLVHTIGKKVPYAVPVAYFDELPESLLKNTEEAKVIPFTPRRFILKYAVAAVITGLLGFGLFNVFNQRTATDAAEKQELYAAAKEILQSNSFEQTLASLDDQDILAYLENKGQDVEAALVAAAATEVELPEPEEYLFDENTLEEFLGTTDLNPIK